jgi:hypothetical protein
MCFGLGKVRAGSLGGSSRGGRGFSKGGVIGVELGSRDKY